MLAWLEEDTVNGEAQRLQDIERALSTKSALLENLRVNSVFRLMEKRALKTNTLLEGHQKLVSLVQGHIDTGVITSKDAAVEIEAAHSFNHTHKLHPD